MGIPTHSTVETSSADTHRIIHTVEAPGRNFPDSIEIDISITEDGVIIQLTSPRGVQEISADF